MVIKKQPMIELEFSEESTADLRGRQSVRTTFKLSERAIDALSILAAQLGIKQKSLFDHLIEDTRALRVIAREFDSFSGSRQRVAKTYVISRRTLDSLEKVSDQYNTPRDALVEYSIERILPLLEREKEKHAKRKELLTELSRYLRDGQKLLLAARESLGEDDAALLEILHMLRTVDNCHECLAAMVEKGKKIEEF